MIYNIPVSTLSGAPATAPFLGMANQFPMITGIYNPFPPAWSHAPAYVYPASPYGYYAYQASHAPLADMTPRQQTYPFYYAPPAPVYIPLAPSNAHYVSGSYQGERVRPSMQLDVAGETFVYDEVIESILNKDTWSKLIEKRTTELVNQGIAPDTATRLVEARLQGQYDRIPTQDVVAYMLRAENAKKGALHTPVLVSALCEPAPSSNAEPKISEPAEQKSAISQADRINPESIKTTTGKRTHKTKHIEPKIEVLSIDDEAQLETIDETEPFMPKVEVETLSYLASSEKKLEALHTETKNQLKQVLTSSFTLSNKKKATVEGYIEKGKLKKAIKIVKKSTKRNKTNTEPKIKFLKQFIQHYENEGWVELNTSIQAFNKKFYSQMTPFNQLDVQKAEVQVNIFDNVIEKGQGISSHNINSTLHAANLWHSRLVNDNDQEIFSCIRHASLSHRPDDKRNKENNKEILNQKVKEFVMAAAYSKYKEVIEKRINGEIENTAPLDLKIVSDSLLTLLNVHLGKLFHKCEKNQFYQQKEALDSIQKELKSISIAGVEIPINLEIMSFSTGVNNFALGIPVICKLFNIIPWYQADNINKESFKRLFGSLGEEAKLEGWVGDYLEKLGNSEEELLKRAKIQKLVDEIKFIFNHKNHRSENLDRYKLSVRLMYLTYLIDAVPAFNCKSGKDRTGMLDAEIKAVAAHLDQQNDLNTEINIKADKETLQAFHLDTSNFVIQRLNTGLSGNISLRHKSPYFKNIFTDKQSALLKGFI